MPVLKTRDVDRALVRKLAFEKTQTDHQVYRIWVAGRLAARTYISHGGRELSRFHVAQMAKQLRLSTTEFVAAVRCPLSHEDYLGILMERVPDLGDD